MSDFLRGESIVLGYRGQSPLSAQPTDFVLPENQVIGLLGPNGSGKSTLLSAITGGPGILAGKLLFRGKLAQQLSPHEIAREMAFVSQDQLYSTNLAVTDVLRLAYLPRAGLFGKLPPGDRPEIVAMLKSLGLSALAQRSMANLSMGERQRVFLGRALLQSPNLLLLDEPTNHLDPGGSAKFWAVFGSQPRRTCLLSTHDLTFARTACTWILALQSGQVFYNGPAQNFWNNETLSNLFGEPLSLIDLTR